MPPSHSQNIPTFYFPRGCPKEKVNIDAVIAKIEKIFSEFPNERATLEDMGKVAKVRTFWPSSKDEFSVLGFLVLCVSISHTLVFNDILHC